MHGCAGCAFGPSSVRWIPALIMLLLLAGPVSSAEGAVLRSDRLIITFEPSDARFADRVVSIVNTTVPRLIADIGIVPSDTVRIHIAESLEAFRTFTPGAIPDWGEGYAVPDLGLIVLKSPRIKGSTDNLHEVVVHESAHILLHSSMRSANIPRWLDEGFAMYSAREWGLWDRVNLIAAVLTDNLIPLGEIRSVNTFSESRAQLAYQESALAVQFIIKQYGRDGLQALLRGLRKTGSINRAAYDAFGISAVQLEQGWDRYMEETYGWRAVLGEALPLLLGPLFVTLFVLSYVAMRWRRHQTLKRWEREETLSRDAGGWRSSAEDEWNQMKQEWEVLEGDRKD